MRKFVKLEDRPVTKKEKQILELLGKGFSNGQIADSLYVTRRTVESHMRNLFLKAKVKNRTCLLLWAASQNHTPPPPVLSNLICFPLSRVAAA